MEILNLLLRWIKKIRDVEESGWIRVPNMHEAIIPQKLFDTVQEVLKLDTCASKGQQTVNLFSGIVRCGGCGQNMVRRTVWMRVSLRV